MMLNDLKKSREGDFRKNIRSAIRGLWSGSINYYEFIEQMTLAIRYGYTYAWYDGAGKCGILPSELSPEELLRLDREIMNEIQYLSNFANSISQNSKRNKGKLAPLFDRAEMWVNNFGRISGIAMSLACQDKKLKWVWNPLKEHCSDCQRLNNRVYRASIWSKYNISPRMRRLACGGFKCGCRFEETQEPVTPGRPPMI